MRNIKLIILLFFGIISVSSNAQLTSDKRTNNNWNSNNVFNTNVFVENHGQFDSWAKTTTPIKYAINNSDKIFFTNQGLTYKLEKIEKISEEKNERIKKKTGKKPIPQVEIFLINLQWEGANPNAAIEVSDEAKNYYTFGEKGYENIKAKGYKKITYKNIYNGIDVEYIIPEKGGVKYNLIVRKGADISQIRMKYSGDFDKIKIEKSGNIIISTHAGDIIDHAPQSYYEDTPSSIIPSAFQLEENTVSFNITQLQTPDSRLQTPNSKLQTLVVDPWTTLPTSLTTDNNAFDVDYDRYGNVYVSGGTKYFKLAKYSGLGNLIWTFTNPSTWDASLNYYWYSRFCIIPETGTTLIGESWNGSGPRVMKIDPSGNLTKTSANFTGGTDEIWIMFYNKCINQLIGFGGGGTTAMNMLVIADTNLSSAVAKNSNGTSQSFNDVAAAKMDNNGDFYAYISSGNHPKSNYIEKSLISNNYAPPLAFDVPSGYNFSEGLNQGVTGYVTVKANIMALNGQYLFTYDGKTLDAWDKANGAHLASQVVDPAYIGGEPKIHDGIAVNECNEIFVAGNSKVHVYSFNGSSFIAQTPITNNVSNLVFDIQIDGLAGILYISGKGFLTQHAINPCNANPMKLNFIGDTCKGSVTASVSGGTKPYHYHWNTGDTTSSLSNLQPNWYYITVTDTSCDQLTVIDSIQINKLVIKTSNDTTICNGSSAVFKVTGGKTYLWAPSSGLSSTTDSVVTASPSITTTYIVIGKKNACTTADTIVLTVAPNPVIILTNDSTICKGDSIQLNASGGNTYSWKPSSSLNNSNISNPKASPDMSISYVVTVKDTLCTSKDSVLISVKTMNPVICSDSTICVGESIILSASGGNTYLWSPSTALDNVNISNPIATPDFATMYYVVISDLPCSKKDSVYIDVIDCKLTIPNVFTPNADGKNDKFEIVYKGFSPFHLSIFNRWGRVVFTSDDKNILWDGKTSGGEIAADGVYYYVLSVGSNSYNGSVTIIR